ncbi:hypothetical protein METP3_02236 [Methanosarcinales archaeon]|nr:hypothetical protein METP3_02236 [Methanosarcinales archaeon]
MSNSHTTNDIKSNENAEPQMTAETYRFVMSWDNYPEPATGEPQVKLGVHTRMTDFSVLNFKDGIRCFPAYGPTVFEQKEPRPGAGFCEGNHYGEKSKSNIGKAVSLKCWQTQSSKEAWNNRAERLHRKEVESLERTVYPAVPHVCTMCMDMDPSKKACKLSEQSLASLCSLYNKHRGLIVTPVNKRQSPYMGSLRQKLDEFEKRNRPAKIWRVSTLPTLNRNDGKFLRYDTNETGEPIRVYQDSDPRLVPEIAFSHDRTEDISGYDECAFPDDWRMDRAESSGNDDNVFMDINDNSEIKRQCFEMPKPNWVSVTRTRRIFTGEFRTYYSKDKYTELHKVWHWDPVNKFTFTVEERTVVVPVRHDLAVMRTEEYPTLINVQTEGWFAKDIKREAKATGRSEDELRAENTILVQSSTVITKKERKYYSAKREEEQMKRRLTGYLILKDAGEGVPMPSKHKWPIRSKRAAAPMVQLPVPEEGVR